MLLSDRQYKSVFMCLSSSLQLFPFDFFFLKIKENSAKLFELKGLPNELSWCFEIRSDMFILKCSTFDGFYSVLVNKALLLGETLI